jgi:hypothetical protein
MQGGANHFALCIDVGESEVVGRLRQPLDAILKAACSLLAGFDKPRRLLPFDSLTTASFSKRRVGVLANVRDFETCLAATSLVRCDSVEPLSIMLISTPFESCDLHQNH